MIGQAPDRRLRIEKGAIVIQKNWQELIKPNKLEVIPGDDPKRLATVVAEPLERGFGLTLGNSCAAFSSRRCRARRSPRSISTAFSTNFRPFPACART